MSKTPRSPTHRPLTGTSPNALSRKHYYSHARIIRSYLQPIRQQEEVGRMLGMSRQLVERAELSAIAKILSAFKPEIKEA